MNIQQNSNDTIIIKAQINYCRQHSNAQIKLIFLVLGCLEIH